MNIRFIFAALTLAACPLAVQGQNIPIASATPHVAIPGAVTLRYKFALGQVNRYKIVVDSVTNNFVGKAGTQIPITNHIEATLTKTVKDIRNSDGAATVEIKMENVSVKTNSRNTHLWKGMQAILGTSRTILMTSTGKILSYQSDNLSASNIFGMNLNKGIISSNYALPQKPAQIGQNWNANVDSNVVGMQMLINSTLIELTGDTHTGKIATIAEKINGSIKKDITKNISIPIKEMSRITGFGTVYFGVDAGAALSQDITIQINSRFLFGRVKNTTLNIPPHAFQIQSHMHMTLTHINDTP